MNKYTVDFEIKKIDGSSYFEIPIKEKVKENESLGDWLCIDAKDNILEVCYYVNIDDEDVRDFIKENFKDYRAVIGFISKIVRY